MLTSGLFKSFIKQVLFNTYVTILIVLVAINQMRGECAGKPKQTRFVNESRCKYCYYCCYFLFFQDYGTFFICEDEEEPKQFYKVFAFWSTLKTFDIKEGSRK